MPRFRFLFLASHFWVSVSISILYYWETCYHKNIIAWNNSHFIPHHSVGQKFGQVWLGWLTLVPCGVSEDDFAGAGSRLHPHMSGCLVLVLEYWWEPRGSQMAFLHLWALGSPQALLSFSGYSWTPLHDCKASQRPRSEDTKQGNQSKSYIQGEGKINSLSWEEERELNIVKGHAECVGLL